jgi:hypothetical protein
MIAALVFCLLWIHPLFAATPVKTLSLSDGFTIDYPTNDWLVGESFDFFKQSTWLWEYRKENHLRGVLSHQLNAFPSDEDFEPKKEAARHCDLIKQSYQQLGFSVEAKVEKNHQVTFCHLNAKSPDGDVKDQAIFSRTPWESDGKKIYLTYTLTMVYPSSLESLAQKQIEKILATIKL